MTKLTVDLEDLKPLIKQAQDTKGNIEQLYNQSRIYLSIARSDSNMAETYYRNSKTQLDTIVNVLQTTYNALMELQAAEPPRSPSTGNGLQEWITKMVDYSDPTIWGLARKVAVGAWNWLTTPSVDQLLAKMKNNSELAYQASTQQFAEANISSIRLREQLKEHNKELYDEMLELAKVYAQGGQSAVEERLARLKETNPELYEKVAPYAEYARYFDEATESPLTTLSTYQARIEKLQKEWFEVDADDTLTAEQKKERQNALHETANQYRDLMNKQFPEASMVYELLSESKKTTTTVDGMKSIMNSLANNHPALAGMLSELGRTDLAMDIYKGYQDQTIKGSNLAAAEAYKQKLGETLSMAFPLAAAVLGSGMNFSSFYAGDSSKVAGGMPDKVPVKIETNTQGASKIIQEGGYDKFLQLLANHESFGGNYGVENQFGYLGKYQMGELALIEAGFYTNDGTRKNDYIGNWTERAKEYGITSKESFLNSPEGQEAAIVTYHKKVWGYVKGYEKYIGTDIKGVTVTASGLLAAGHLLGSGGLAQLYGIGNNKYKENSAGIPVDGNGTPITKYMENMGGFDLTDLLGINPDIGKLAGNSENNTVTLESIAEKNFNTEIINKDNKELYKITQPISPTLINVEGSRSVGSYNNVLDQFEVESSPRYTPSRGLTYCNVYVEDVLNAMGVPLPNYMLSRDIQQWMGSQAGKDAGWIEITAQEAQQLANSGYPTIGVNNSHVAMIASSPNPSDGKVYVSQAGDTEWITRLKPIDAVWAKTASKQFFYHK